MENLDQQNLENNNQIPDQSISEMYKILQKKNPDLVNFGKEFQDNLKTKNFPNKNWHFSELVLQFLNMCKQSCILAFYKQTKKYNLCSHKKKSISTF